MNTDNIIAIARTHLPDVFMIMVVAGTIFLASFVWALLPANRFKLLNHWGRNILKQAPSIMTALGLFGTFYGLTDSLRSFGTEVEQIQTFISDLKSVFIYSILGIGSAAVFMVLNMIINAIYHNRSYREKHQAIQKYNQQNQTIQQNNDAIVHYLAAQLKALNQLNQTLKNQNPSAPSVVSAGLPVELQQTLQDQAEFAPYLAELANMQELLNKTVTKLLIPHIKSTSEFQEQMLALLSRTLPTVAQSTQVQHSDSVENTHTIQVLQHNLNEHKQLLQQIHTAMSENHHTNQQILAQLQSQTASVNTVVSAPRLSETPKTVVEEPQKNLTSAELFTQLEQELAAFKQENEKLFTHKYPN